MQGGGFDFPPMPAPAGQGDTPGLAAQPPRPGTAASGPSGLGGDPLAGQAVYVSYEEKREVAERKPGRKSGGHTYVVKFFLCDTRGTEYLAATGARLAGPACHAACGVGVAVALAGGWRAGQGSRLGGPLQQPRHGIAAWRGWCALPTPVLRLTPLQARTRVTRTTCMRTPLDSPSCVLTTRR